MRKHIVLAAFAALLLLSAGVVIAMPPSTGALMRLVDQRQQALADFIASLNLTPAQKVQANVLQQSARQARIEALLAASITAEQVKRELRQPNADLRRVSSLVQATVDEQLAAHRSLTAQRLSFYESLTPTQQAQVREQLAERIERLERVRELVLELAAGGL